MPLGKPTPDGEIVQGTRHYAGRTLGEATIWKCPACGKQNEGRKPEQGCGLCGAGDPGKHKTESVKVEHEMESSTHNPARPRYVQNGGPRSTESIPSRVEPIRILRLIEYLIHPGQDVDGTLRRSLVGRIEMAWGTITATIIDSTDMRQEDLLGLARKQPGVWLANPEAMHAPVGRVRVPLGGWAPKNPTGGGESEVAPRPSTFRQETRMEIPDADATFAQMIEETYGFRLCNTLALALGNLAEELRGNTEPEKFLSPEECLSLANALMQQIPADWQGEGIEAPAPTGDEVEEYARRQEIKARLGAKPEPIYKEPPNAD